MSITKWGWLTASDEEYQMWYQTHEIPTCELDAIAQNYNCDKSNAQILSKAWKNSDSESDIKAAGHNYTQIYDSYFSEIRYDKIRLLELGIGNYPTNGYSLRVWLDYFPNAEITFIDQSDRNFMFDFSYDRSRVKFYCCDQSDNNALSIFAKDNCSSFDVIIDDCSHIAQHQFDTLKIFFRDVLKTGGLYFIEDIHDNNFLEFLPPIFDSLNRDHVLYTDTGLEHIEEISKIDLYRSLICLHKGNRVTR